MVIIDIIAGLFVFVFVGMIGIGFLYPKFKQRQLRKEGKIIRILLFEKIGDQKIFRSTFQGIEKNDERLGIYFYLKKVKKVISPVSNEDYFGDIQFGKCLMLCKFADDDYRVMSRLNKDSYLKKVSLPIDQYLKTEVVEDETGNKTVELKTDKDGNSIPLLDENKEPLPDHTYIPFDEPLGVDQTHREVMRFNRIFSKRMQEKRKEVPGFWEKYMPYITTVTLVFIMFIAFAYMTNKNNDFMDKQINKFKESSEGYIAATNNPSFAENIIKNMEKKNKEEGAPPK